MSTEEELGYHDAIRQVQRSLQRRLKTLHDSMKAADGKSIKECEVRISEIEHILQVVDSLHR